MEDCHIEEPTYHEYEPPDEPQPNPILESLDKEIEDLKRRNARLTAALRQIEALDPTRTTYAPGESDVAYARALGNALGIAAAARMFYGGDNNGDSTV